MEMKINLQILSIKILKILLIILIIIRLNYHLINHYSN